MNAVKRRVCHRCSSGGGNFRRHGARLMAGWLCSRQEASDRLHLVLLSLLRLAPTSPSRILFAPPHPTSTPTPHTPHPLLQALVCQPGQRAHGHQAPLRGAAARPAAAAQRHMGMRRPIATGGSCWRLLGPASAAPCPATWCLTHHHFGRFPPCAYMRRPHISGRAPFSFSSAQPPSAAFVVR